MALLSARSLNPFLQVFGILALVSTIVCIYFEFLSGITIPKHFIVPGTNTSIHANGTRRKVLLAFRYWEQFTMATNNFLQLTALAAYGGRRVVVPFVKNSHFSGVNVINGYQPLDRYYNVTRLSNLLFLYGYATLIDWEQFQNVCKGKLDILVHFEYKGIKERRNISFAAPYFPCKSYHRNGNLKKRKYGFDIGRQICVDVAFLTSVEKFEEEVLEGLPCVGILEWRGASTRSPYRTKFDLSSTVRSELSYRNVSLFLNSKLLRIAAHFIKNALGAEFIALHVRSEHMLKAGKDIATVKKCLLNLTSRVKTICKQKNMLHFQVFLATDFNKFGSSSKMVVQARKHAKSLMEIMSSLGPVVFRPEHYRLTDHGEVAITEMTILTSGKFLIVVGGGSFQNWVVTQFHNKKNSNYVERLAC